MKTYKKWEVIKMLEENPRLKFENLNTQGEYKTIEVCKGVVCWGGDSGYPLYVTVGNKASTWRLVQEPVTFMEAAKALENGKKVRCEIGVEICHYENSLLDDENNEPVSTNEVLDGKWFVEVASNE